MAAPAPAQYDFFEKMLAELIEQFTQDAPSRTYIEESSTSATADMLTGIVKVAHPSASAVRWFEEHTPRGYGVHCATGTRKLTVEITIPLEDANEYQLQAHNVVRQRVALAAMVAVCMALVLVLAFV